MFPSLVFFLNFLKSAFCQHASTIHVFFYVFPLRSEHQYVCSRVFLRVFFCSRPVGSARNACSQKWDEVWRAQDMPSEKTRLASSSVPEPFFFSFFLKSAFYQHASTMHVFFYVFSLRSEQSVCVPAVFLRVFFCSRS